MTIRPTGFWICVFSLILLVTFKLTGLINISWLWVLTPVWFFPALILVWFGLLLAISLTSFLFLIILKDEDKQWGVEVDFWNTIMTEMTKGNFSFAILVVGAAQLLVMNVSLTISIILLSIQLKTMKQLKKEESNGK